MTSDQAKMQTAVIIDGLTPNQYRIYNSVQAALYLYDDSDAGFNDAQAAMEALGKTMKITQLELIAERNQ